MTIRVVSIFTPLNRNQLLLLVLLFSVIPDLQAQPVDIEEGKLKWYFLFLKL